MPDHLTPHLRPAQAQPPRRGWDGFVARYGWRAYALPVLVVVTIAAVLTQRRADSAPRPTAAQRPAASTQSPGHGDTAATGQQRVEGLTHAGVGFRPGTTKAARPITVDLGDDRSNCTDNGYSQLILVSISKQHLWACQGSKQVNSFAVTTGADTADKRTPLGSWRVQAKQRDRYLVGADYRDYVKYWVPFNGDFGLHDASWQKMPFGSAGWRTQGSHGCVHVPTPQMKWVYGWSQVNDTVVTIEA